MVDVLLGRFFEGRRQAYYGTPASHKHLNMGCNARCDALPLERLLQEAGSERIDGESDLGHW